MEKGIFAKMAEKATTITDCRNMVTKRACADLKMKKEDIAQAIFAVVKKRHKRTVEKKSVDDLRISLQDSVYKKLTNRFKQTLPLRVASNRWAGDAYYVVVPETEETHLVVSTFKEYSPNGKWNGNSTKHTLFLKPSDDFETIGGLFTVFQKKADTESCLCTWYEQGRGFGVKRKTGFLVKGYHIEKSEKIKDLPAAVAEVDRRLAVKAKKDEYLTAKNVIRNFRFCDSGVRNFCEMNGLDFSKAKLKPDELQKIVYQNIEHNRRFYARYLRTMGIEI